MIISIYTLCTVKATTIDSIRFRKTAAFEVREDSCLRRRSVSIRRHPCRHPPAESHRCPRFPARISSMDSVDDRLDEPRGRHGNIGFTARRGDWKGAQHMGQHMGFWIHRGRLRLSAMHLLLLLTSCDVPLANWSFKIHGLMRVVLYT